jgi:hypothetical protein
MWLPAPEGQHDGAAAGASDRPTPTADVSVRLPGADAPFPRALALWRRVEQVFDRAFGVRANPLRQLGALGFLAFWLLAISGIWLYAVFDTAAAGAYASIEALSRQPASVGGLMRSLHRYATDALVLFTTLHLLREALLGRWRGFRRFSWWTGVALLPLLAVSAVGGFWLNWDRLGQYSAIATAEWLDLIPLLAQPLARNFLGTGAVSDRLFSLFVFVHLGAPLLLLFALWFHVQRITAAAVFPARRLGLGTLGTLLLLSLVQPVRGQGAADLAEAPTQMALDWFVLALHPLADAWGGPAAWGVVTVAMATLVLPPLWPTRRSQRPPVAVVDAANCNGCRAALPTAPMPRSRWCRIRTSARARCWRSSTPTCAPAAASAPAPARRRPRSAARSSWSPASTCRSCRSARCGAAARGRAALSRRFGRSSSSAATTVPIAACGADDVCWFSLLCAGQLPPSFVEYALRDGAAGVLVASCRTAAAPSASATAGRPSAWPGQREPHLRAQVDRRTRDRSCMPAGATKRRGAASSAWRAPDAWPRSRPPDAARRYPASCHHETLLPQPPRSQPGTGPRPGSGRSCSTACSPPFIGVFSHWPTYRHLASRQALVKVSFVRRQAGGRLPQAHRRGTGQAAAQHARPPTKCPRERSPDPGRGGHRRPAGRSSARRRRRACRRTVPRRSTSACCPCPPGERLHAVRLRDDARARDGPSPTR